MPKFDILPVSEAIARSSAGRRREASEEYLGYIRALNSGQAGKLSVAADETTAAVRRRLGTAAKVLGKELVIKRIGHDIYFWIRDQQRRRRGRRPNAQD